MTYNEIKPLLQRGKIGLLPNYDGYFKWNYAINQLIFYKDNYKKYNLDNEKKRND